MSKETRIRHEHFRYTAFCDYSNPLSSSPKQDIHLFTLLQLYAHQQVRMGACKVCVCVWNPLPSPLIRYQPPGQPLIPIPIQSPPTQGVLWAKHVDTPDATLLDEIMHASLIRAVISFHTRTSTRHSRMSLHMYVRSFPFASRPPLFFLCMPIVLRSDEKSARTHTAALDSAMEAGNGPLVGG